MDPAVELFRERFRNAISSTGAQLSVSPAWWPAGKYLRLRVRDPRADGLPGQCDPIGLVALAEKGLLRSVLHSRQTGTDLGLSPELTDALIRAADDEGRPDLRQMLIEDMERLRELPVHPITAKDIVAMVFSGVFLAAVLYVALPALRTWWEGAPFPGPNLDLTRAAYEPCKGAVLQRLSTPSTASFPGAFSSATTYLRHETDRGWQYDMTSYVDAQNTYGAVTRSRFQCRTVWGVDVPSEGPHWMETAVTLHTYQDGRR